MSKFPSKANGYTFNSIGKTNEGDRVAGESTSKAVNFVYAVEYNNNL